MRANAMQESPETKLEQAPRGLRRDAGRSTPVAGLTQKVTFCRICEPLCGLVATVEDGRITSVRGDKENPLSQGLTVCKEPGDGGYHL